MITPSGGDDTPIIQAELNAKGYAELDSGNFHVSQLDLTNRQGVALLGKGAMLTRLIPTANANAVIDVTGSSNARLNGLRIAGYTQPVVPTIGILAAQMHGSGASDVLNMDDVRIDGTFGLAAFYVVGVQSSRVVGAQLYNYQPNGMACILTGNNIWGITSKFVTLSTANDMKVSDWTFLQSEFHNMANGWALWMGGVDSARFYGGNCSSSCQSGIVSNNAVIMGGVQVDPENIIFDGITFYSDFAPSALVAVSGNIPSITFRANKHTMPLI